MWKHHYSKQQSYCDNVYHFSPSVCMEQGQLHVVMFQTNNQIRVVSITLLLFTLHRPWKDTHQRWAMRKAAKRNNAINEQQKIVFGHTMNWHELTFDVDMLKNSSLLFDENVEKVLLGEMGTSVLQWPCEMRNSFPGISDSFVGNPDHFIAEHSCP